MTKKIEHPAKYHILKTLNSSSFYLRIHVRVQQRKKGVQQHSILRRRLVELAKWVINKVGDAYEGAAQPKPPDDHQLEKDDT